MVEVLIKNNNELEKAIGLLRSVYMIANREDATKRGIILKWELVEAH